MKNEFNKLETVILPGGGGISSGIEEGAITRGDGGGGSVSREGWKIQP